MNRNEPNTGIRDMSEKSILTHTQYVTDMLFLCFRLLLFLGFSVSVIIFHIELMQWMVVMCCLSNHYILYIYIE